VAWLVPELAAGAEADVVPEDAVVVATPDPPEVVWTVVPVAAAAGALAAVAVVVVWAAPLGRVYAMAPAVTRLAAPSATVAERSRCRPRCRATTADSASRLLASMVLPPGSSTWSLGARCM
jgi:hypothetical protein